MFVLKIWLLIALNAICLCLYPQSTSNNQLDSLGLKQGVWVEYRVLPSEIVEYGEKIISPNDSNKVILTDKIIFEGDCIVLLQVGNYNNGLKTGLWKEYYPNDNLKSEVNYLNGIPVGPFRFYYPNGNFSLKGIFSNVSEIEVYLYDEEGKFLGVEKAFAKELLKSLYYLN